MILDHILTEYFRRGSTSTTRSDLSSHAAFLDRDGVLNERPPEHDYVRTAAGFRGSRARRRRSPLRDAGFVPVVVSNQRGVARGLLTWETLAEIEKVMRARLLNVGVHGIAFYYCAHDVDEGCSCRKPKPGLLFRAAEVHDLDLRASVMVGDSWRDVEAGRRAGCRTVLLERNYSEAHCTRPDYATDTLVAAADWILQR